MVQRLPVLAFLLMLFTLLPRAPVWARDYYFSAAGNDVTGEGSRSHPWQSIAKLNTLDLDPGDNVFFRRGDTFHGPILLDAKDSATDTTGTFHGDPITLRSFGNKGDLPRLSSPRDHGLYAVNVGGIELRDLEFAGTTAISELVDPANTTTGLLFENTQSYLRQEHIVIDTVVVHGFGEAGINFRARNPATSSGGFKDVQVTSADIHTNGRHGILTSVSSDSGMVADGALFAFQSRAHANVYIGYSEVHHTTGKQGNGGNSGSGIILPQVDGGLVEFNVAHHNGGGAGGGGVAIWTWESHNVVIQFNEAYSNTSSDGRDGGGFGLDGGVTSGVLQYNYSHSNFGAGYGLFEFAYASPMSGNLIRYNISEADGGGLAVWGSGPRFDGTTAVDVAADSLAYHNTIVQPDGPGAHFFGTVANVGVYNTIFVSSDGSVLVKRTDFDGAGGNFSLDFELLNNIYWSDSEPFLIAWEETSYTSLAAWAAATGQEICNGTVVGLQEDPGLRGPFTGGAILNRSQPSRMPKAYRLRRQAAAVDAGSDVASLPLPIALGLTDIGLHDFSGVRIPRRMDFDIGASERR
jgi:hypothetical protein